MVYGGIELGGTKIVYGVKDELGNIDKNIIPTTTPDNDLNIINNYFKSKNIDTLGIASFGPLDIKNKIITSTPKNGWANTNLSDYFKDFDLKVNTDVIGSCLGEVICGEGKGLNRVIYGTIGTGIGFGAYINGTLIDSEAGHIKVNRHKDDTYKGSCPYHQDCLEGLASGPAIEKRWNKDPKLLDNKLAWDIEAYYISQGVVSIIYNYLPDVVILGGGVMHHDGLLEMIKLNVQKEINDYVKIPEIVLPKLKDDAGLIGAIELGKRK